MSNEAAKKDGDSAKDRTAEVRKSETVNFSDLKIDPKLLKDVSVPTNAHSGSAGGQQEESIGIDFGNGKIASRQNKLTEAAAAPLAPTPRPVNYEKPPLPSPILPQHQDMLSQNAAIQPPGQTLNQLLSPKASPVITQELSKQPQPPANPPEFRIQPKEKNGQVESDQPTQPKDPVFAPIELINRRTELQSLIEQKIANPKEREQFISDMRKFESDFKERSTKSEADKHFEMANTYRQVSRLLSADTDVLSRYPQCKQSSSETPWRVQAAEQIMHQAAEPTSVDQGVLAVCPTAALQVRQYWRDPSAVAKLVTDVLLTGSYKTTTGERTLDMTKCPDNLIPDIFARQFSIDKQIKGEPAHAWGKSYFGVRSFASQIYDVTATNVALSAKGLRYEQPTAAELEHYKNKAQGVVIKLDSGERISWGNALKAKLTVTNEEIVELNRKITGNLEIGFVILGPLLSKGERQNKEMQCFHELANLGSGAQYCYSIGELSQVLQTIKDTGLWPPIASVDTRTPPFSKEDGGGHLINITGLSKDAKHVSFDNTWGKPQDRNGAPAIDTSALANSIEANVAHELSISGGFLNLLNYRNEHPQQWKKLVQSWLDLSSKLATVENPKEVLRAYLTGNTDNILADWCKRHPDDVRLLNMRTYLSAWLTKFPAKNR